MIKLPNLSAAPQPAPTNFPEYVIDWLIREREERGNEISRLRRQLETATPTTQTDEE